MRPRSAGFNGLDGLVTDAITPADPRKGQFARRQERPDFRDLRLGELCTPIALTLGVFKGWAVIAVLLPRLGRQVKLIAACPVSAFARLAGALDHGPVVAFVVQLFARRDGPVLEFPGDDMRIAHPAVNVEVPVPSDVEYRQPGVTAVRATGTVNLGLEPSPVIPEYPACNKRIAMPAPAAVMHRAPAMCVVRPAISERAGSSYRRHGLSIADPSTREVRWQL